MVSKKQASMRESTASDETVASGEHLCAQVASGADLHAPKDPTSALPAQDPTNAVLAAPTTPASAALPKEHTLHMSISPAVLTNTKAHKASHKKQGQNTLSLHFLHPRLPVFTPISFVRAFVVCVFASVLTGMFFASLSTHTTMTYADAPLDDSAKIVSSRSVSRQAISGDLKTVTIKTETGESIIETSAPDVKSVLAEQNITVGFNETVVPNANNRIEDGGTILVGYVETRTESTTTTIKFDTQKIDDPTLTKGKENVQTKGSDGKSSATFLIQSINGVEINRTTFAESIVKPVQNKVILVGTFDLASINVDPGSLKADALNLLPTFGFGADQFSCLDNLWTRESTWNPSAENPSSGAYGIPQALPGSKMSEFGLDWRTNPITQMKWGLNYIKQRYGTPCGAWAYSESVGWY
jgi:hypothetical protein